MLATSNVEVHDPHCERSLRGHTEFHSQERVYIRSPDKLTLEHGEVLDLLVLSVYRRSRHRSVVARTLFRHVVTEVADGKLIGVRDGPSVEFPPHCCDASCPECT